MINQRPNGAGRVFMERIIQWKELEYVLTHPPPPTPSIFHSVATNRHCRPLGIRGGGESCLKNMLKTSCYQFCARHSAEFFGHGPHAQLPSHCSL